jgi:hypothetical protein
MELLRQVFESLFVHILVGCTKDMTTNHREPDNGLLSLERGLVELATLRQSTLNPEPLACPNCCHVRYKDILLAVEEVMGLEVSFNHDRKHKPERSRKDTRPKIDTKPGRSAQENISPQGTATDNTQTRFTIQDSRRFGKRKPTTVQEFIAALGKLTGKIGERDKGQDIVEMVCSPFSHLASMARGVLGSKAIESRDAEENKPDSGRKKRVRDDEDQFPHQPQVKRVRISQDGSMLLASSTSPTPSKPRTSSPRSESSAQGVLGKGMFSEDDQGPRRGRAHPRKRACFQDLRELGKSLTLNPAEQRGRKRKRCGSEDSNTSEGFVHVVIRRRYSEPLPQIEPMIICSDMPARSASR